MAAGFTVSDVVLAPAEVDEVLQALTGPHTHRSRGGMRHVLRLPAVQQLAHHPVLLDIAASFVGPSPVPFRATLFDKSLDSNWLVAWHQDTALPLTVRTDDPAWGPWTTKAGVLHAIAPASALEQVVALRVQLDDSTSTNGPLRVLPGSHVHGVLTPQAVLDLVESTEPVACVAPRGSVIAMRPLLLHASSKATDARPRRVVHIEYAAATLHEGVPLAHVE